MLDKINQGIKKRVLMLTPDVIIDRRILIEAETLVQEGYELYLLAGSDDSITETFEIINGVHIERMKYDGIDKRLTLLYKMHKHYIGILNNIIGINNKVWRNISLFGSNIYCKAHNICTKVFNKQSQLVQKLFGKLASISARIKFAYIIIVFLLKFNLKIIVATAKLSNVAHSFIIKMHQLFVNGCLKLSNKVVVFLAIIGNKFVSLYSCLFPYIVGFNGYEYAYYERAISYRPDIIHVHDLPMLRIGTRLKSQLNVPLIYDMHEFYPEQPRLSIKQKKQLKRMESKNIKEVDYNITVNFMLGEVIKDRYKLRNMHIIQNAITKAGTFDSNMKYDLFREEYPHLKDKYILLYQGWIAPERNLENIIIGMKYVTNPKWVLLLMGYGDYAKKLKEIAIENGVCDKVFFVPPKTQDVLLTYTASADIGIIPYPKNKDLNTHYVSPNKLYEFILAKLPIITNELPYMKYIVEKYNFGIAGDIESPKSFGKAIDEIQINVLNKFRDFMEEFGHEFYWDEEKKELIRLYMLLDKENDDEE